MRRLLCALLFASSLAAQTPVVGSHAASGTGSVKLSVDAGDLTLAFYVPDPKVPGMCSDGKNTYISLGQTSGTVDTAEIFAFSARPAAANAALTITCSPPALNYSQVYAVNVTGAGTPKVAVFSGSSATAVGTIQSPPGDLVVAMIEASDSVTNASGWMAQSTFNSNLLASQTASGPVTASFSVSGAWNMILVDIPPAAPQPFVFTLSNCGQSTCTFTFPMQAPPRCTASDGLCSLLVQINPPTCGAAFPSSACTSVEIDIIKTVSLPTPQIVTIPIVKAASP